MMEENKNFFICFIALALIAIVYLGAFSQNLAATIFVVIMVGAALGTGWFGRESVENYKRKLMKNDKSTGRK